MSALRVLWDLRRRGACVRVERGDVRVAAPVGVLVDEDRDALRKHKPDLLVLLATPCPCAACQRGEEPHGPRCYCGGCLDADPKWEAWRAELAVEDRAQQPVVLDDPAEADERAAIQVEGRGGLPTSPAVPRVADVPEPGDTLRPGRLCPLGPPLSSSPASPGEGKAS